MAVFKVVIQNPKDYLHAISGVTHLTPKESALLGEIITFMQSRNLKVLDDEVKDHISKIAGYTHKQSYYNLISTLKRKKLVINSHNKMQLRPILFPGTTVQITFAQTESVLKDFVEV